MNFDRRLTHSGSPVIDWCKGEDATPTWDADLGYILMANRGHMNHLRFELALPRLEALNPSSKLT